MQVRSVDIENFRGVERARLEGCGELNVLIGKNNSGKSTLLDAINGFFGVMQAGGVVQLNPTLSAPTNFRRGADDRRIRISVQLRLTDEERTATVEDVVGEAPQMRHALENVEGPVDLLVVLHATDQPENYAHLERLSLVKPNGSGERLLLAVSREAGFELQGKLREAGKASRTSAQLERFAAHLDPEDYARFKDRGREPGVPRSYAVQQFVSRHTSSRLDPEMGYTVETALRESSDYADFRQRLESLVQTSLEDARRVTGEPLSCSIETFAGDARSVPGYVGKVL